MSSLAVQVMERIQILWQQCFNFNSMHENTILRVTSASYVMFCLHAFKTRRAYKRANVNHLIDKEDWLAPQKIATLFDN